MPQVSLRSSSAVHPRACGELLSPGIMISIWSGSSPRMRGTHRTESGCNLRRRFIPAHAGNSHGRFSEDVRPSVHPRACGELFADFAQSIVADGSSPRMRGTPQASPHPIASVTGSSPRMRGTRMVRSPEASRNRFIPAHAGNSEHNQTLSNKWAGSSPRMRGTRYGDLHAFRVHTVHPRACGELTTVQVSAIG